MGLYFVESSLFQIISYEEIDELTWKMKEFGNFSLFEIRAMTFLEVKNYVEFKEKLIAQQKKQSNRQQGNYVSFSR